MIGEALSHIARRYLSAKEEQYTEHPVARFIRRAARDEIKHALEDRSLHVKGSAGQGGWTGAPWIGVFDRRITRGAQKGYYVVYLFSTDMKRVYLSLNQGTTEIEKELGLGRGKACFDELRRRAGIMRDRTMDCCGQLSETAIDLGSDDFLPRGYEAGHALGARYDVGSLPTEDVLRSDLAQAVLMYRTLIKRGGVT